MTTHDHGHSDHSLTTKRLGQYPPTHTMQAGSTEVLVTLLSEYAPKLHAYASRSVAATERSGSLTLPPPPRRDVRRISTLGASGSSSDASGACGDAAGLGAAPASSASATACPCDDPAIEGSGECSYFPGCAYARDHGHGACPCCVPSAALQALLQMARAQQVGPQLLAGANKRAHLGCKI